MALLRPSFKTGSFVTPCGGGRLVHRELDVELDERRSRRVLEVNDAIVDLDLLDWSQFWGLPRQREGRGELGGRDRSGRRAFRERNDRVLLSASSAPIVLYVAMSMLFVLCLCQEMVARLASRPEALAALRVAVGANASGAPRA